MSNKTGRVISWARPCWIENMNLMKDNSYSLSRIADVRDIGRHIFLPPRLHYTSKSLNKVRSGPPEIVSENNSWMDANNFDKVPNSCPSKIITP